MAGRPTDYDPKYCQEIIDFFSAEPYTTKTKKIVRKNGDVEEVEYDEASDFPSFAGFASKIGVHRETLLNWCNQHKEFFDAYKKAKVLQENWSLINGHKGTTNTAFAIFALKNLQGYRDKVETVESDSFDDVDFVDE